MSEDKPTGEEISAAYRWRETMLARADDPKNVMWHGWALARGFWEGMLWERKKQQAEIKRLRTELNKRTEAARWMLADKYLMVGEQMTLQELYQRWPWLEEK